MGVNLLQRPQQVRVRYEVELSFKYCRSTVVRNSEEWRLEGHCRSVRWAWTAKIIYTENVQGLQSFERSSLNILRHILRSSLRRKHN